MKAKKILLALALLALCRPADADWRIDHSEYLRFLRTIGWYGNVAEQGPCKYATKIECQNAIKEYARQMGDFRFASMAKCVECGGSSVSSGGTPEQQMAQGLANAIVSLIFPPKRDTSPQAEIERQNALKRQQEEEQKKQAANQAWKDLQNIEQEKRNFDNSNKLAAGQSLLGKIDTIGGSELKFKTIGTEASPGSAVDLKDKQGTVRSLTTNEEQAMRDKWYEEHLQEQGFSDLVPIPENNIRESMSSGSDLEESKEYKIVDACLDQIAELPGGQLPAIAGKTMLSFINESVSSINATTASILNGTPPPEAVANGTVVQNIMYKSGKSMTIDEVVDFGKGIVSDKGIGFMDAKYGEAGKLATEILLKVGEDSKTVAEIWCAKRL